jgi:DNA-binding NarL/FixJ family response regulator
MPRSHSNTAKSPAPPQPDLKRLLLVDDHPIMRHGLAQLIRSEPGLEVCAEAGNARDGLAAVGTHRPDLVVIDLTLPDKHGLELLKDIQAMHPGTLCLVLSMHDEAMYGERALRAGARGYIMKEAAADHLITAVRKVLSGGIYVSEGMASRMLEQVTGQRQRSSAIESLTDRELEAHRAHIKEKLAITDGAALVRYAVQWVEQQGGA